MSNNVLEKEVLILNLSWLPINCVSVRQALSMMSSGAVTAISFDDETYFLKIPWEEWLKLPVTEKDDFINTPNLKVRAPRVVIAAKFNKTVSKRPKLNLRTLRERDNNQCAYTGKLLKPGEDSMEHIIPKSKGGITKWDNVVLADKILNNKRGNKTVNVKDLKNKPYVPKARLFMETIRGRIKFDEWKMFIV